MGLVKYILADPPSYPVLYIGVRSGTGEIHVALTIKNVWVCRRGGSKLGTLIGQFTLHKKIISDGMNTLCGGPFHIHEFIPNLFHCAQCTFCYLVQHRSSSDHAYTVTRELKLCVYSVSATCE